MIPEPISKILSIFLLLAPLAALIGVDIPVIVDLLGQGAESTLAYWGTISAIALQLWNLISGYFKAKSAAVPLSSYMVMDQAAVGAIYPIEIH